MSEHAIISIRSIDCCWLLKYICHWSDRISCGVSSVFLRKLVALLLVVCYGIPAALGPYWHHHACHGTDHAAAGHAVSGHAACGFDHAHSGEHHAHATNSLACHHHEHVVSGTQKRAPRPLTITGHDASHSGPCAICQFYATAQLDTSADLQIDQSSLISQSFAHSGSQARLFAIASRARGPPALQA